MSGHPAPEVPCRPATNAEITRGARAVMKVAQAAGWQVRATYARGTYQTQEWRAPRVVDSLALRMRRQRVGAVAMWHDGNFSFAFAYDSAHALRSLNVTQLRELLTSTMESAS